MNHGIVARWADIDALLDDLFEQPDDLRRSWLERHCEDAELRAMVLSLLAADSMHAAALEARATAAHEWLSAHATEFPEVPGYRVIDLIGEGGMASVFLAERWLGETVQRVALKRLRLNVYDPTERRRFEHEQHVLARLEHPNIAHLLDAGIAPDGVPWFAMEYVEGQPLMAWCDSRRLGVGARLALFADICAAVQHAHQHLVIHRDLKPSNIQVDNDGNVKLLDFGIARLLEPDTDRPDGTRTELRRLTPGYAAPEQYAGRTTTATDIYALGVILVELLSGQKPAVTHASNSDPLRNLTITRAAADARDSSPRTLERLLAGDVGAIARKATRSEPALRYGSALALAEDLGALRNGRPVAARRGDWRYRATCFIRRNRTAVAAGVVVAATLVVTTAISLYQAREAREQAAHAQAVQAFVEDMLAPLRRGVPATRMPRLDEVLAQGVRDLERHRRKDPAVYSELMMMFAETYGRMGDMRNARTLAARAYAHSFASFGPDDLRTIRALSLRGQTTGESPAGLADLKDALARMHRLGIEGLPRADVLDSLAAAAGSANRSREAMVLFTEAQRQRERALGPTHPDLALGYGNLGDMERNLGNPSGALAQYQKAYRHSVRYEGPETRRAADYLGAIASVKSDLYGWHTAQPQFRAALDLAERIDPDGSPERVNLLFDACFKTLTVDDMAQAEAYCNAAVPMAARIWGEGSRMHGAVRRNRTYLLAVQGRLQEAREEGVRVRASLEAIPGEVAQVSLHLFHAMYSEVQYIEGDYAGMRDALLGLQSGKVGSWAAFLSRLALACEYAPAPECPGNLVARADAALHDSNHPWPSTRIVAQLTLARLALKRSDAADAHRRLDDIEATATDARLRLPATHRWMAEMRMLRGDAFATQGDRDAALHEWRAAEAVFASRYTPEHPFRRHLDLHLRSQVATH